MTSKEAHCAREMLGLNTDPVPYQCRRDQTEEDCQAAKDLMEKLQAEAREALEGICDE